LFGFLLGGSYRTKTVINDTELLRQYSAHHSEQAFASLVQRYLSLVYFAALRRTNGDTHLAEDITQQVFATLATNAATLQRHAVLTGWLYVTTRHAAANAMRTEKRRFNREQEAHAMQETPTTRDPQADWNQLRPQLDHAIDELNERDRLAVLLRFFENRPFAEIGATLRVSEDAARVRVDRALDKLRTLLVRRGITSTAAALAVALSCQSALAAPPALAASVTGFALTSTASATASGASTAFHLLHFMSTTKTIIATTSALAAVALGTALYEIRETHQIQSTLAIATQENATLRDRLQREAQRSAEIEKNLRTAEALAASLQKSADEAAAAKKSAQQTNQTATAKASANPAGDAQMQLLMTNQEYRDLNIRLSRTSLRFTYGPLYRKLGLTPQQIADFEAAKTDQQQTSMDTIAAAQAQGISVNDSRLSPLIEPSFKAIEDKLRVALGDSGVEQYKAYQKMIMARTSVDSLASALYYTETPLTADQADQLTQSIASNTGKSSAPDTTGIVRSGETNWDKVSVQAEAFLNSSQLATLQALAERKLIQRQISELSRKLTNAAIATPAKTSSN
jgi:RNA polymerase sigma factor (sigma-70 family)